MRTSARLYVPTLAIEVSAACNLELCLLHYGTCACPHLYVPIESKVATRPLVSLAVEVSVIDRQKLACYQQVSEGVSLTSASLPAAPPGTPLSARTGWAVVYILKAGLQEAERAHPPNVVTRCWRLHGWAGGARRDAACPKVSCACWSPRPPCLP